MPHGVCSEVAKRLGVTQESFDKLLLHFAREHTNTVSDLRQARLDHEYDRVRKLAHNVSGAASNIGAAQCGAIAKQIELRSERVVSGENSPLGVEDLILSLERELTPLLDDIHMTTTPQEPEVLLDVPVELAEEDFTLLMDLAGALKAANPVSIEELMPKARTLLMAQDLEAIQSFVFEYEYEKARDLLLQSEQVLQFKASL